MRLHGHVEGRNGSGGDDDVRRRQDSAGNADTLDTIALSTSCLASSISSGR